ncbi:MAG: NAD(P)/FAD-dependent oxidoreductase [Acidobacteria bacterium]|nr:NAD(P)/FAD-dependent oxidoreductase [Acidobacteriota bacterium]
MPSAIPGAAHRVVIVGGGFGGLEAAKALRGAPVRVTLIDKRNFHLFQPLLYQVASGGLSPGDIAAPLRAVLRRQKNAEVLLGEVGGIDLAGRQVLLKGMGIEYDTLILAAGATHSYLGHPEWETFAPGLKTVEDATEIRRRMLFAFEAAELELSPETRRQWLTFVIVGAGPTGVELAGALGEIANETLREDFRRIHPSEARILLLDAASRLLPAFPEELSRQAERSLIRLGVRARCGVRVTGIDREGVTIERAEGVERVAARTAFWAAGIEAAPLARVLAAGSGLTLDRAGRVIVRGDLSVPDHPEIFVIGDLAHCEINGRLVPAVAPAAMQMGRYVARVIRKRLAGQGTEPFRYADKGTLAVIGRAAAVADFGTIRIGGWPAWLAWLFIHLMYLVGFQNRVLVFIQWAFHYFTFNRGARLITGGSRHRSPSGTV